jgi:hypothetical protein
MTINKCNFLAYIIYYILKLPCIDLFPSLKKCKATPVITSQIIITPEASADARIIG